MYLKPSKARETLTLITSNMLSAKLINAVQHLFDFQIHVFQKRFLAINNYYTCSLMQPQFFWKSPDRIKEKIVLLYQILTSRIDIGKAW